MYLSVQLHPLSKILKKEWNTRIHVLWPFHGNSRKFKYFVRSVFVSQSINIFEEDRDCRRRPLSGPLHALFITAGFSIMTSFERWTVWPHWAPLWGGFGVSHCRGLRLEVFCLKLLSGSDRPENGNLERFACESQQDFLVHKSFSMCYCSTEWKVKTPDVIFLIFVNRWSGDYLHCPLTELKLE